MNAFPRQQESHPVAGAGPVAIFLHLPKTAGTTVSRIVERQYPRRLTYTIMQESGPYSGPAEAFAALPETRRAAMRLVKGHVAFGIHRALPGPSCYFTLLRDPVARVLSHYAHARRDPQHNLYPYMQTMTLAEALAQRAHVAQAFDNFQTRLISGVWHTPPFGALDDDVLQRAKDNLRRTFAFVGLVERFDESLILLQSTFGWGPVFYTRHNTTGRKHVFNAPDDETLELVRHYNRLDQQLYDFAAELFAQQIEQAGAPLQARVTRFQKANRFVSPFLRLYWEARKVSVREAIRRLKSRV